ncbi:MAG: cupin domain-containing protein [Clostridia bacterium]|nr:cupin domain-containing protein [Clostridia bacterium]
MIKHGYELKSETRENMRGGNGAVELKAFLSAEEMNGKNRLFSRITLAQGCSIGYHEHHGESEIFVVCSGNGVFNDNGKEYPVSAGDVLVTSSGMGHSIACAGSQNLELIALIVLD